MPRRSSHAREALRLDQPAEVGLPPVGSTDPEADEQALELVLDQLRKRSSVVAAADLVVQARDIHERWRGPISGGRPRRGNSVPGTEFFTLMKDRLGFDRRHIERLTRIGKLDPRVKEAIRGTPADGSAQALEPLTGLPLDTQLELAQRHASNKDAFSNALAEARGTRRPNKKEPVPISLLVTPGGTSAPLSIPGGRYCISVHRVGEDELRLELFKAEKTDVDPITVDRDESIQPRKAAQEEHTPMCVPDRTPAPPPETARPARGKAVADVDAHADAGGMRVAVASPARTEPGPLAFTEDEHALIEVMLTKENTPETPSVLALATFGPLSPATTKRAQVALAHLSDLELIRQKHGQYTIPKWGKIRERLNAALAALEPLGTATGALPPLPAQFSNVLGLPPGDEDDREADEHVGDLDEDILIEEDE